MREFDFVQDVWVLLPDQALQLPQLLKFPLLHVRDLLRDCVWSEQLPVVVLSAYLTLFWDCVSD